MSPPPLKLLSGAEMNANSKKTTSLETHAGLSSGFVELDRLTTGIQPDDLIIVASRPNIGKTSFTLNIVQHVALVKRKPVVIFSLEMDGAQLAMRMIALDSGLDKQILQCGMLEDNEWPWLTSSLKYLNGAPIFIDDTIKLDVVKVRSQAERFMQEKSGLGLIVIDYLQLMSARSNFSEIALALKQLATELRVPIILVSQLDRRLESRQDKRPLLTDLGAIEQHADLVLFLYREECYSNDPKTIGKIEVIVAKNQNGVTGMVSLTFNKKDGRFENPVTTEDAKQDPLFEAVKKMVIETRIPSISLVQRTFRINYTRAANILAAMEGDVVTTKGENGMRRMMVGETHVEMEVRLDEITIPNAVLLNNTTMSFENFVIGKANELAHAAAYQVLSAKSCKLLLIYGGVGLGKTHLLHAISKRLIIENSQAKVQYVHASNFVSEVVRAFKTKKFDEFKQRYMTLDVLLIEDIQHLADKPGTQQELLYILNSLFESNRQVIMTCNVSPNILTGFDPQLLSLFSGGFTVAIDAPTLEMREAFLMQLFNASMNSVDKEVINFIAELVTSNFRELEGAYNRIDAFARFHARTVTLGLVKEALKDIILAQCFKKTKGLDYEQYILGSPEGKTEDCFSGVQQLISDAVDQIKVHQTAPNAISGISTCFPSLDNYTSGLQRGDLIVVAGRPSMSERSFVRNIAMHVALAHKLPVAIMENETNGIRMATRMLAARAKIGSHDLLQGGVGEDELGCFEHAVEALGSAPVYFSSMTPVSVEELGERLRLLSRRVGSLGLVVVDCLPELKFSDAQMNGKTALKNSFTSRYLKLLATELNTSIVVFSPVDRDIEERSNKRPALTDLSGMAAIANAADLVLIVYRDEVYDTESEDIGTAEILIGKNLHGPIGSLRLKFDGRCGYFEEMFQG